MVRQDRQQVVRNLFFTFIVGSVSVQAALAGAPAAKPLPNAARIDEIATYLSDEPGFPEYNITNRVFWEKVSASEGKRPWTICHAEDILKTPLVFPEEESYTNKNLAWGGPSMQIAKDIQALALAECLENKGRFLDRIAASMDIKSRQTTWIIPYHDRSFGCFLGKYRKTDLCVGMDSQAIAVALDHLRGKIPADVVGRITAALWRNCFSNYLATAENPVELNRQRINTWFFGGHNWNVACHGWVIGAALRTVPEKRLRARFVEGAERGYPYYLNGFSADGYCHEGIDYWNFGYGMYLHLAWTVRAATRDRVDFFRHPAAKRDFVYAYGCQLVPGLAPRFGDCGDLGPNNEKLLLGAMAWPEFRSPALAKLGPNVGWFETMPYRSGPWFTGRFPKMDGGVPYQLPIRSYFPDAQILVCRPRTIGPESVSVCLRGGHNACPHNHNDIGQYVISVGKMGVEEDPAGAMYTVDTFTSKRYENPILSSYAHGVPLVDGHRQSAGRSSASTTVSTDFTDGCDTFVLDLAGAYPSVTNKLRKLTRTLRYFRETETVEIEDEVAFAGTGAYESPLSTFGLVLPTGVPNEYAVVRGSEAGEKRLLLRIDTHGTKCHVRDELVPNLRRASPRRFTVVVDEPCASAKITFRYARQAIGTETEADLAAAFDRPFGKLLAYYLATRYPARDLVIPPAGANDGAELATDEQRLQGLVDFLRRHNERGTVDEIYLSGYRKKLAKGSKCERALPVVLEGPITNTAVYVAFQNDFNRELMTLHSLPRGRHTVTVDGREIGTWDAQPLGEGINISRHPLAPQYAQSLKVRALVDRLWTLERRREKSEWDQAEIKRLRVELKKAARPVSHSYKTAQEKM